MGIMNVKYLPVTKIINFGLSCIFTSVSIFGCAYSAPEDMPAWKITIATPSLYYVGITEAYGVNIQEDWTMLTHGYSMLGNRSSLDKARRWLGGQYDGFGIPLHTFVNTSGVQIGGGTNVLPDSIYIYWISYIHQPKFYATRYDIPEKVRQFIQTRRTYIRRDGVKRSCYKTNFVFGLLPDYHAKVWLDGCATYTYITELPPAVISNKDIKGFNAERYADGDKHLKQKATRAGITTPLYPIPWDKVNKVYWDHKADKVDSIEDYLSKSGQ